MKAGADGGVLLTSPGYYGTLASARCYGRAGIPVHLAEDSLLTQTGWSRFVTHKQKAPSTANVSKFADWLMEIGKRHPGLFLYATSDDLAWVLASRREELGKYYRMYQPPLATIVSLLDKRRLSEHCAELGIDVPETVFVDSERELEAAMPELHFPLLIKPRTQMLLKGQGKGRIVRTPDELRREYKRAQKEGPYEQEILERDPTVAWPMLQRYHAETRADTYSISGFIDESGEIFELRAAQKVFQRPRTIGVGLCFVSQPVEPTLREKIYALCRKVGYFGAFEVEFVRTAGRHLMIDFNPRFYGQLGFEVARGMPLPLYVYYSAHGLKGDALRAACAVGAAPHSESTQYVYGNRWLIELVIATQSVSGRLTPDERQELKARIENTQSRYSDSVRDMSDSGPLVADMLIYLRYFARHPRDFFKQFFLDM